MMKKTLAAFLALLMLLCAGTSSLAEPTVTSIYDSLCTLLFDTANVTVNGKASFILNDETFKEVSGFHLQDGVSSVRELTFLSPVQYHLLQETGYTVVTEDYFVTASESFYHGDRKHYYLDTKESILSHTAMLEPLLKLTRCLLVQADSTFAPHTAGMTAADGKETIRLELSANEMPEAFNALLMIAARQIGSRYFNFDYENFIPWYDVDAAGYYDYNTTTSGLLMCTSEITFEYAALNTTFDTKGRLSQLAGNMDFRLTQTNGDFCYLTIQFELNADKYGKTNALKNAESSLSRWESGSRYITTD